MNHKKEPRRHGNVGVLSYFVRDARIDSVHTKYTNSAHVSFACLKCLARKFKHIIFGNHKEKKKFIQKMYRHGQRWNSLRCSSIVVGCEVRVCVCVCVVFVCIDICAEQRKNA